MRSKAGRRLPSTADGEPQPVRPRNGRGASVRVIAVGAAVAVVLADSSIVTLALPDVVREFDAGVVEVAWVLISFNLVLALAALPAARLVRGGWTRLAWRGGLAVFAASSLACALSPRLEFLVVARCVQALGGAAIVAAALEQLRADLEPPRALAIWGGAGIFGAAVGPALGGALTELLAWEAIFLAQVPLVLLAIAGGAGRTAPEHGRASLPPAGIVLALVMTSAALTAALFLLVLMLIEGWRLSPAEAAGVVSIMPVAAVLTAPLGRRIGDARIRTAVGAIAVAGGLASLGLLPGAEVAWTIAPQLLIGFGLGLTLTALTDAALAAPGATAYSAASTIAARHAGVVLGLLLLAPIFTADLEDEQVAAERAGSALLLDARMNPGLKIRLGERLAERVERADGRLPNLRPAFRGLEADPDDRPALGRLRERLVEEVRRAATHAFSRSFLFASGLALLVLPALLLPWRRGRT